MYKKTNMKVLVVSYVDGITEEIKQAIEKFDDDAEIYNVKDIFSARCCLSDQSIYGLYDFIIIDMMAQEFERKLIKPILEPALEFLRLSKNSKLHFPSKVFALFDPDETGDKGKIQVKELGFKVADFSSNEWQYELYDYLAH